MFTLCAHHLNKLYTFCTDTKTSCRYTFSGTLRCKVTTRTSVFSDVTLHSVEQFTRTVFTLIPPNTGMYQSEQMASHSSKPQTQLKNGVFWDVAPCGSCKNRRFGGT
jgi:hypothetical protein